MLTCIFAKNRIAPPLTAPYDGPYKVIVRSGRVMKILIKGKVETVSLDRVKPPHLESEPETGTETKRETQIKTKNSKTTEIVKRVPKDQIKPSSALTQNSDRKRPEPTVNTQTRSDAFEIGKNLATTSQHKAHRENLPKQFTPYVATRVGRKIHTPARFVQMVHAFVAPNDIYGGTNYTNRNNHNL